MEIKKNSAVTLNYSLKNEEGTLLDTSEGREPLTYLHGVGGLIPGLESELEGKQASDKLQVVVSPENGYGKRQEELKQVVPKDGFQGDEEMVVGMQVQLDTEQGPMVAMITDINENEVTLDMNHPLADMELHFDVEIVEVRDASDDEISHGHVHGPGGHQH